MSLYRLMLTGLLMVGVAGLFLWLNYHSDATFADGHDEMLVGDAIAASAAAGRWVEVAREAAPS